MYKKLKNFTKKDNIWGEMYGNFFLLHLCLTFL